MCGRRLGGRAAAYGCCKQRGPGRLSWPGSVERAISRMVVALGAQLQGFEAVGFLREDGLW